jgi:hypothetical protein
MLSAIRYSRREILRLASAAGLAGLVPVTVAAAEFSSLAALSTAEAERLLAATRTLFPHDTLEDEYYISIVVTLDTKAAADREFMDAIKSGLQQLPGNFAAMSEAGRETELRRIEGSPFFQTLYNETLSGLYRNPDIARMFGNEGSSIEYGGFINRGFDDIDWLPVE